MMAATPFAKMLDQTLVQQCRRRWRSGIIAPGFRAIILSAKLGEMTEPPPFDGFPQPRRIVKGVVHVPTAAHVIAADHAEKGKRAEYPAAMRTTDQIVAVIFRRFQIVTGEFPSKKLATARRDELFPGRVIAQIYRKISFEKLRERRFAVAHHPQCRLPIIDDLACFDGDSTQFSAVIGE